MRRKIKIAAVTLGVIIVAIQLVPYGRSHVNPPVRKEPDWDNQRTRQLARRACFDCHSNETKWPWYSHFAPASWILQHHVDKGRRELNFSEWDLPQKEAKKSVKEVQEGKMPLRPYALMHPEARLQPAERQELINGLGASLKDQIGAGSAR